MEEKTLFKLARAITDTGTDIVSSKGGTVTYRITSLKRELVNGKVGLISTPSCTLGSASVSWATWGGVTVVESGYLDVKINYSENTGSSSRSTTLTFTQNESNNKINLTATQKAAIQKPSTFTLSGLPTDTGYYLFGKGARPQNTSSDLQMYLQGLSATSTTTMSIPFYANDSIPGSRIECTTGDKVAVYTKSGTTWILEGTFIVPSAGGTVSI